MAGVQDRVALVTGAGSAGGIGFACAAALQGGRREGGGDIDHGAHLRAGEGTGRGHVRACGGPGGDGPGGRAGDGGGRRARPHRHCGQQCRHGADGPRRAVKAGARDTRRAVAARHGHQHHHGVQDDEARGAGHDGAALWPHRQHELGDRAGGVEPQGPRSIPPPRPASWA